MLSSSESESEGRNAYITPTKKQKVDVSKHRGQRYRNDWERNTADFGRNVAAWLKPHPQDKCKAVCSWCDAALTANVTQIKYHVKSVRHQKMEKGRDGTSTLLMDKFLEKGTSAGPSQLERQIKETEVKLSAFLPTHNLSFQTINHLLPTLKACFPDSAICQGMQMKRNKCTRVVTNVVGAAHEAELTERLKQVKFSILTDESTDLTTKTLCVMVRFYDNLAGRIVSRFYDLQDVFPKGNEAVAEEGATGAWLHKLIVQTFKSKGVPMDNVLGFGCDAANTNVGESNSIISRLRQECPGIILMKCICHSLHRASSSASKCLPRGCEDLAKNVHSYFKHSTKRKAQLSKFQDFVQVKDHQMLGLAVTRWLSFLPVVERILEQWEALRHYFSTVWISERTLAAEQIFQALKDPFSKLYYSFLVWVLPKISCMNAYFQSEAVIVTSLHEKMEVSYRELLTAYMSQEYVAKSHISTIRPNDVEKFIRLENIYLGVAVMEGVKTAEVMARPDLIVYFREKCREYMIQLCLGIKERFPFGDPLLTLLPMLHPDKALSIRQRDTTPTIMPLCDVCPRAKPRNLQQLQQLDDEWRRLPFDNIPQDVRQEKEVDVFWHKLYNIRNAEGMKKYISLPEFALDILTLPHANADTERVFSKNNLTKTKTRNKLGTATIKGALLTSQCVKGQSKDCCYGFSPTEAMLSRMTSNVLYRVKDDCVSAHNDSDSDDSDVM